MAALRENLWHIFLRGAAALNLIDNRTCTAQSMYIPCCLRICNDRDVWPKFMENNIYSFSAPVGTGYSDASPLVADGEGKGGEANFTHLTVEQVSSVRWY